MAATPIGTYVKDLGVWKRANGGTPVGFSGPQVRDAGVWKNCILVDCRDSESWGYYAWVNIDGELSVNDFNVTDIDYGSPWSVGAGFRVNADGDYDKYTGTFGWTANGRWRDYDCGREYEVKFERTSGTTPDSEPTLNTWLNLTDPDTNHFVQDNNSGTTQFFNRQIIYDVRIREKVSAPAGGNDIGTITLTQSAEGDA